MALARPRFQAAAVEETGRAPRGFLGINQHLAQGLDQRDDVVDTAALLIAGGLEQQRHGPIGIMFVAQRVHRVMQARLAHLGEGNVLADHVLIDHTAIQLFQRTALGDDAGRDPVPALGISGFRQQLAIGGQAALSLEPLVRVDGA